MNKKMWIITGIAPTKNDIPQVKPVSPEKPSLNPEINVVKVR
jgi:hypothetical protein